MRRGKGWLGLLLSVMVGLALMLGFRVLAPANQSVDESSIRSAQAEVDGAPSPQLERPLQYETIDLPQATVHLLTIPTGSPYTLRVGIDEELQTVSQWAANTGAIAVLNAGFFDPQNGQTTSYVSISGDIVADPRDNSRLMDNPDLTPYLDKILNRSEFRRLACQEGIRYVITAHNTVLPDGCTLVDAVGAGPQLLPTDTGFDEGFLDFNAVGEISRDALGSRSPNARTAVGIRANGDVVWAMVAQKPDTTAPSGMTLAELADFLAQMGVTSALNLDGGSSSTLYFEGITHSGRLDAEGNPIQRPVKSVLLLAR